MLRFANYDHLTGRVERISHSTCGQHEYGGSKSYNSYSTAFTGERLKTGITKYDDAASIDTDLDSIKVVQFL